MKTKQIDEATLGILSLCEIEGYSIRLPHIQLERKQYLAVNEILGAMGGKWTRKIKAHVFDDDPTARLEEVLLTGEIISPQDYGCFYTPPDRAQRVVELANIKPGMVVLEPSAGQGAIADEIIKICPVDCIEILPENCRILLDKGHIAVMGDFLALPLESCYDRICMNPPFAPRQIEIDHVLHAWKFLKPGGRLVSIMSAGVLFRENKKTVAFREMLNQYGRYERNPEGSFKVSGTGVNTVTVIMDKPKEI